MIAILKESASDEAVSHIVSWIEKKGLKTDVSRGENETIIGLVGDTTKIDPFLLESMDVVERVQRVSEPFKRANRKFHPEDSVIDCGHGVHVGGDQFQVIAGPCSVEGENLIRIARRVKAAGATMLRGGAYKPRTSPYAYQAWAPPVWTCCARRLPSSTCRSSPRSWTRATCRSSWTRRSTSCRSRPQRPELPSAQRGRQDQDSDLA